MLTGPRRGPVFFGRCRLSDSYDVLQERGRPIARLVPVAAKDTIGFLESIGSLRRARKDLLALGDPLPLPKGHESGSRRLARLRSHER
jgi:antitoxin (DNA-binding transcriptional repressor) of toxin-antitoxin stability system